MSGDRGSGSFMTPPANSRKITHVGIILDGARRWAVAHDIALFDSYSITMNRLAGLLPALFDWGILTTSIYLLSKRNLARTGTELDAVARAEALFVSDALPVLAEKYGICVRVAGLWTHAPAPLRAALSRLPAAPQLKERVVNLLVAYDPCDELLHSFRQRPLPKSREDLVSSLWVDSPIDLVVRTGGSITLSDFLPLQCGYARLVFLSKLFNDISPDEIVALAEEHENGRFLQGR